MLIGHANTGDARLGGAEVARATPADSAARASGLRFARRIRVLRSLGLGLGGVCVGATLWEQGAHPLLWSALTVNGLAWPHLAWWISQRSRDPRRTELRNLLLDSAFGGAWIALMAFNPLPSALLATMLAMDKICVGGWRMLRGALAVQAIACMAAASLNGFAFDPHTSLLIVLACLPFLVAYPIAVSTATYGLSRKVLDQNRQLEQLNRIDWLTGLLNRHHWELAAHAELQRHRRRGRPAALLMIDIDHFKQINDRHGHPVGDEVIRRIAAAIRDCVRDIDTAGRYGGDEFGIVLAETTLAEAAAVGERIRSSVESAMLGRASAQAFTVSVGAAEAGLRTRDYQDWISQADAALYRAKTGGRNMVERPAPEASAAA